MQFSDEHPSPSLSFEKKEFLKKSFSWSKKPSHDQKTAWMRRPTGRNFPTGAVNWSRFTFGPGHFQTSACHETKALTLTLTAPLQESSRDGGHTSN